METEDAAGIFTALAQSSRLAVLRELIKAGPAGRPAGAIAETLAVPAPTMSFHLKELSRAGLVQSRREGRKIYYAADYGGVRELIDFLLADCCQGDKRLCGPYVVKESAA